MVYCCLPGILINDTVSSHGQQEVSDSALCVCQADSSIILPPMMNSKWGTLLYIFAGQSHESCLIPWPTGSEWHCWIYLQGSLMNQLSFLDQQGVSDTALCLSQAVSSIMSHSMTWLTDSKWHRFISLPRSLINHVSSHDQQAVSDTALCLSSLINHVSSHHQQQVSDTAWCLVQAVSSMMSHFPSPTGSEWHCFISLPGSISIIPWPTGSEWHCFIESSGLPGSLINHGSSHDQQAVSNLFCLFARQSHQSCFIPWPTVCEWHCFTSLPGHLINHGLSHAQQAVSDTAWFLCQAVLGSIMPHPMTNRKWVGLFLCQAVSSIYFHPMTNRKWVLLPYVFSR